MLKFFALVLIVSGTNAAWTSCNLPGVPSPDKIVSEYCPNDRCVATIGTTFKADFFFTPVNVHYQLRTKATGYFTIGPGVPLPLLNLQNACQDLYIGDVFAGCPTEPFIQKKWKIALELYAGIPLTPNGRIRFELKDDEETIVCADITVTIRN